MPCNTSELARLCDRIPLEVRPLRSWSTRRRREGKEIVLVCKTRTLRMDSFVSWIWGHCDGEATVLELWKKTSSSRAFVEDSSSLERVVHALEGLEADGWISLLRRQVILSDERCDRLRQQGEAPFPAMRA